MKFCKSSIAVTQQWLLPRWAKSISFVSVDHLWYFPPFHTSLNVFLLLWFFFFNNLMLLQNTHICNKIQANGHTSTKPRIPPLLTNPRLYKLKGNSCCSRKTILLLIFIAWFFLYFQAVSVQRKDFCFDFVDCKEFLSLQKTT